MQKVNETMNSNMTNYLTNYKAWAPVTYNVAAYGIVGDGIKDNTAAIQSLIYLAISEHRKAIFFQPGIYIINDLVHADKVVFFGDNATVVGSFPGKIYQIGVWVNTDDIKELKENIDLQISQLDRVKANKDYVDSQLAEKAKQIDLDVVTEKVDDLESEMSLKATTVYVNEQVGTRATTQYVDHLVSQVTEGTPESFNNLAAIIAAYPNGDNHVKLNLENGYVYKWDGTNWVQGWEYQAYKLSLESVKMENTTFIDRGKNLYNRNDLNIGQVVNVSNGQLVVSESGNSSSKPILVEPNTAYYKRIGGAPNQNAFYDSDMNFISGNTSQGFTTPANCRWVIINVGASSIDTQQLEKGTSFTGYEPFGYKLKHNLMLDDGRISTDSTWSSEKIKSTIQQEVKFLGIRYNLNDNSTALERVDNVDQNNVMNHYPFNEIRLCTVYKTTWGATRITYDDESAFSRDGTLGDVMVEIPKHYFKRYRQGNIEYILISGTQLPGYNLDPAFIENGKELEKIYVASYDAQIVNGVMKSITGVRPTTGYTLDEMRTMARNKGKGFGLLDYRTVAMLQRLFMVCFADRNAQKVVGTGIANFAYQTNGNTYARVSENNSNVISIDQSRAHHGKEFKVNCHVAVGNETNLYNQNRIITNIEFNPTNGYTDISFSGDPVNIEANRTMIYTVSQKTGYTDNIVGHVGMANYFGADGFDAVKVFHIENLWGNVWNLLDGIGLDDLKAYVGQSMSDYTSKIAELRENYVSLPNFFPLQLSNDQNGGEAEWSYYIKNLVYDKIYPAYQLPFVLGGGANKDAHFADPFYTKTYDTTFAVPAYGGGFDHMHRCGLFTMRFWYAYNTTFEILNGGRLIYKPI